MNIAADTMRRAAQAIADVRAAKPHAREHAEIFISIERQAAYFAYLDGRTARARALNKLCDQVQRAAPLTQRLR